MKRSLSLILSLLLALSMPALAENAGLPDCFIPTTMMMQFNTGLPDLFKTMSDADPAGTTAEYLLSNPDMSGGGMRFSNDDGNVVLACDSSPTSPSSVISLSIAGSVNAIDATTLKFAFLKAVADSDSAVAYETLVSWLNGDGAALALGGYTLTFERDGGDQVLTLATGGAQSAR